jgi:hypothetical protein
MVHENVEINFSCDNIWDFISIIATNNIFMKTGFYRFILQIVLKNTGVKVISSAEMSIINLFSVLHFFAPST